MLRIERPQVARRRARGVDAAGDYPREVVFQVGRVGDFGVEHTVAFRRSPVGHPKQVLCRRRCVLILVFKAAWASAWVGEPSRNRPQCVFGGRKHLQHLDAEGVLFGRVRCVHHAELDVPILDGRRRVHLVAEGLRRAGRNPRGGCGRLKAQIVRNRVPRHIGQVRPVGRRAGRLKHPRRCVQHMQLVNPPPDVVVLHGHLVLVSERIYQANRNLHIVLRHQRRRKNHRNCYSKRPLSEHDSPHPLL
jgi:hypothetical protein